MKFRFFDFEVFEDWWLCVFGDLPEDWKSQDDKGNLVINLSQDIKDNFVYVTSDDENARDKLLAMMKQNEYVLSGYNIKNYDLVIANAIYQGLTPQQIHKINDMIINPGCAWETKEHIMLQPMVKRKLNGFAYVDLMDDCTGSLKEKEAVLGLNVLESSVDFTMKNLTPEQKEDVIYYCKQDVYAAMMFYCRVVDPYIITKLAVAEHYNIPKDICLKSTNARVVAMALGARKTEFADADTIKIELPEKIREYCYENVPTKILEKLLNYNDAFTVQLFDNTVSYGNGGVHSTYSENIYVEENDEWCLLNVDAESYYPSMLIQFKTLSRAVKNPEVLKYIFDERMAIKHKEHKTEEDDNIQKADKLILNTTFGASGNKFLDLYDPHNCTKTCRLGQIFLTALANKMYKTIPDIKIIQTNTDGILAYVKRKYLIKLKELEQEWTNISGINMEEDNVAKIWQRDVNNYLLVKTNGKIKRKGGWLNDTILRPGYVTLASLQAFVCTKAAQKWLLERKDPMTSIVSCKDIMDFAIVCTKGPTYRGVFQVMSNGMEVELFRSNRIIATKDTKYGMLYKYKMYKGERRVAKMPNIPEHCLPINRDISDYDFKELASQIDYLYYVQRTADLLDIPWRKFENNTLVPTDEFDYLKN